jgi:hypothetical protein
MKRMPHLLPCLCALAACLAATPAVWGQEVFANPVGEDNGPVAGPMAYGEPVGNNPIGGPMMYGGPVGDAPIGGPMLYGAPVGNGPLGGPAMYGAPVDDGSDGDAVSGDTLY